MVEKFCSAAVKTVDATLSKQAAVSKPLITERDVYLQYSFGNKDLQTAACFLLQTAHI